VLHFVCTGVLLALMLRVQLRNASCRELEARAAAATRSSDEARREAGELYGRLAEVNCKAVQMSQRQWRVLPRLQEALSAEAHWSNLQLPVEEAKNLRATLDSCLAQQRKLTTAVEALSLCLQWGAFAGTSGLPDFRSPSSADRRSGGGVGGSPDVDTSLLASPPLAPAPGRVAFPLLRGERSRSRSPSLLTGGSPVRIRL